MFYKYLNRLKSINFIIILLGDIILIVISFFSAVLLRYEFVFPAELQFSFQTLFLLILIITKIFCFRIFGLYRGMWRHTGIYDMIKIIKASLLSSIIFTSFIYYIYSFQDYSRSIFIIDLILCAVLIGSSRLGIRLFFSNIFSFNNSAINNKKNVLLIGAGSTGETILRESFSKKNSILNVVGFLDDNPNKQNARLHDVPVLGLVSDLNTLTIPYDEILICAPTANRVQMRRIIEECKKTKKPFKTLPSLSELAQGKISIQQFREVSLSDLLGRKEIKLDESSINNFLNGKRILVTGAGGSIGSELVRQCIQFEPAILIMIDISELNLFEIGREVSKHKNTLFKPVLADIRDAIVIEQIFDEFKPQVVFHAAAYKHVPMQESFPWEAIKTNIFGTVNVSEISINHHVEKFVLVSTDKAVKPTNVMGATKRLAEMVTQKYNREQSITEFMAVRFGNVLGSSGSVIPIFQEQIKNGGPITITDPEMERYFMSIPEASQLILQAGSLGTAGEVYILDMGSPIKIIDIAYELIRLSGYEPDLDIPIKITGTRPGEKKIEELSLPTENLDSTKYEKIFVLNDKEMTNEKLTKIILEVENLKTKLNDHSANKMRSILSMILPEYDPEVTLNEPIYITNDDSKAKA